MTTEHFVAHVRVEKVSRDGNRQGGSNTGREVEEITALVCKGYGLVPLIDTVKGHLDLIADAGA